MNRIIRKPTRSDTNWAVWLDAGKILVLNVEELCMYLHCSTNNGADQLHRYSEADLGYCFHICKTLVFSCCGSYTFHLVSRKFSHNIVDMFLVT